MASAMPLKYLHLIVCAFWFIMSLVHEERLVPIKVGHEYYKFRPGVCKERRVRQFLAKIERRQKSGCWIWCGGVDGDGYGYCSLNDHHERAHRAAHMIFRGDIPTDHHLHHTCETTLCVNPWHLEPVTPAVHVLELTPNSFTYQNAHKTHCQNGHPFEGENLRIRPNGKRRCRLCHRDWAREQRAAARLANPKPPRTHCRRGHEYTEENVRWYQGRRYCKACHAENTNRYYHEKHNAALPVEELAFAA